MFKRVVDVIYMITVAIWILFFSSRKKIAESFFFPLCFLAYTVAYMLQEQEAHAAEVLQLPFDFIFSVFVNTLVHKFSFNYLVNNNMFSLLSDGAHFHCY